MTTRRQFLKGATAVVTAAVVPLPKPISYTLIGFDLAGGESRTVVWKEVNFKDMEWITVKSKHRCEGSGASWLEREWRCHLGGDMSRYNLGMDPGMDHGNAGLQQPSDSQLQTEQQADEVLGHASLPKAKECTEPGDRGRG